MYFDKNSLRWPPIPGLLTYYSSMSFVHSKPRELWTKEEWQRYAEFLERRGKGQNELLIKMFLVYKELKRRLSRSSPKPTSAKTGGLLGGKLPKPVKKRGPKAGKNDAIANKAIKRREELEASGGKITDEDVVILILTENGGSKWRANESKKAIAKRMSILRSKEGKNIRIPKFYTT